MAGVLRDLRTPPVRAARGRKPLLLGSACWHRHDGVRSAAIPSEAWLPAARFAWASRHQSGPRSEVPKMNPYKLKEIVEYLRKEGSGLSASHDELLRCYGLDETLPADEQEAVKRELAAIADAEMFMEELHLRVEQGR